MSSLLAAIICCLSLHPIIHTVIFLLLWLRGSSINGKLHLPQLSLDPAVSAFEHRACSVTCMEGTQLPERVTSTRYEKCWGRAGITQQSSSDFVRMRICLPLANSLVSGQGIFTLPSDSAPGTRLDDQMRAEGPSPGSGPHSCFPVQWLYWAHRILFDPPPAAATKRVGGLLSLLSKSLSKINKTTNEFWFKYSCKHIYATACRIWLSNRIPWAELQCSCFQKTNEKIHIYHWSVFNCEFVPIFSEHIFHISPAGLFPSPV